jgi:Cadherin domain
VKLTHWLSGLYFPSSWRSISRRNRRRSSRRSGLTEGARRLAAVERLEERLLLTVAPVFDPTTYADSIADDSETGTLVLTVFADDGDGDAVTYQWDAASSSSPFAIDADTGDITVDGTLDAGTQSEYVLTVEAVDPGNLTGTATVTITLTATNNPPEAWCSMIRKSAWNQ